MDIKEISGKITNSFGGYGVFILLGAVALVFISNLGSSDSETLQAPTGYSAYPDSVTNANVIIGEVNDHTTAEIKNLGDTMSETIGANHDETMEKLNTGFDNVTNKIDSSTSTITGKIDSSTSTITGKIDSSTSTITGKMDTNTNTIMKNNAEQNKSLINQINNNQQAYTRLENNYNSLKNQNNSLSASLKKTQEQLTKTQNELNNSKSSLKSSNSLVKKLQNSLNNLAKKTGYTGKNKVVGNVVGVIK